MHSFEPRPRSRQQARRRRPAYFYPAFLVGLVLVVAAFVAASTLLAPVASPSPSPSDAGTAVPSAVSVVTPSPSETAPAAEPPSAAPSTERPASSAGTTASPTLRATHTPVTPAPTRSPARTPTPEPTQPDVRSVYVTNGSRSSNRVALTFDFGGRVGDAAAIVDYLVAHDVKATVFITGETLDGGGAGPQVLERICGRAGEFDLGNHSYDHSDFDGLTAQEMRGQLAQTEAAFAAHCSRSPRPFFRPPDGAMGGYKTATYYRILDTLGAAGYTRTIAWDVDTLDWSAATTAANIVDYVRNGRAGAPGARGGSIVLMHLGGYHTLEALPTVISHLRGEGYALVTLRELLGV